MTTEDLIVIGKNSFIGNAFVRFANARGASVAALSSADCNFLNLAEVKAFFSRLDDKPKTILFLAAVNKKVDNSYDSYLANLELINNFLIGAENANIAAVLYTSSADVYGAHPVLPLSEKSSVNPDTYYGLAKYCGEWILAHSDRLKCPVTILRIPGVFGKSPGDHSAVGALFSAAKNNGLIRVTGEGQVRRDYVALDDLCLCLEQLLTLRYDGIINCVTGKSRSILEIAEAVRDILGSSVNIEHVAADSSRDFDLIFDNSKLKTLLPEFSFSSLEAGLESYTKGG